MDYVRYLHAKQTVDDRALNIRVLHEFESCIAQKASERDGHVLRVVEVGGGIGAMFMRLWRRGVFSGFRAVEYTIIDVKCELLHAARTTIANEAGMVGKLVSGKGVEIREQTTERAKFFTPHADVSGPKGVHHIESTEENCGELAVIELVDMVKVNLVHGDAIAILRARKASYDVLIGAAVLDLWELESTLTTLLAALDKAAGLAAFYFPINFDGTTHFFPASSEGAKYDACIEKQFHLAMGRRLLFGQEILACHTGRYLIPCLRHLKATIMAEGGSSWILYANNRGEYPADEAHFAYCLIDFIQSTCETSHESLHQSDSGNLAGYIRSRRQQIAAGTLCYVAHNVDVCGVL